MNALYVFAEEPERYLVPVESGRLSAQLFSAHETVCVEEQCYYIMDKDTADAMVRSGAAGSYEPVVKRYLSYEPNDEFFSTQWPYNNASINWKAGIDYFLDTTSSKYINPNDIEKPVVAVIDTGFVNSHDDLNKALFLGGEVVTVVGKYGDLHGHGTHVTGIIGATTNNITGVASSSYGNVTLMPIKAIKGVSDTIFSSDTIEAIGKIIEKKREGVNIVAVNMSFGGTSYSQAEYDAVKRLKDNNIIVVAAAGNKGENMTVTPIYPASYDLSNIVCVSALSEDLTMASYSNYGGSADIAAPGSNFISLGNEYLPRWTSPEADVSCSEDVKYYYDGNKSLNSGNIPINATVTGLDTISSKYYVNAAVYFENKNADACKVKFEYRTDPGAEWISKSSSKAIDLLVIPLNKTATTAEIKLSVSGTCGDGVITLKELSVGASDCANIYEGMSGTSMATPFITGLLAAGKAIYRDISNDELISILYGTADYNINLIGKVSQGRRVNAGAFLNKVALCKISPNDCLPTSDNTDNGNDINPGNNNGAGDQVHYSGSSGGGGGFFACAVNRDSSTAFDIALISGAVALAARIAYNSRKKRNAA